jgi:hypothetical protein
MKSTQIYRDKVGEREVSTIYWENCDGTGYYETAIREANGSYSVYEWGIQLPTEAEAFHAAWVILADKAQHYEER